MVVERDRTEELRTLFDVARSASASPLGGGTAPGASRSAVQPIHSTGEVQKFNRFAQAFAKDIASVSENIMRLAKLTSRQNVFDDQSSEISALTQVVKASLQRLHSDKETLEELRRQSLSSQRTLSRGTSLEASTNHSSAVVRTLEGRLLRTSQEFRTTLQNQSKNMKSNASRRHLFTAADRPQSFESALFQDQELHHHQQQQLVAGGNVQYYRDRAQAVTEIEAAVAEVGELFNDFTRMVQEQEDTIVRIDTNVDMAVRNVNAGSNELMRYLANLSSNRGLILKVFAILFFFLLVFGFLFVR